MTVTLQPVFKALGYPDPAQQRALVKLLQASGAFGDLHGVDGVLNDRQTQALLQNLTFDSAEQAAHWLHEATQEHMIRRPPGVERYECIEPLHFKQHRDELQKAVESAGMVASVDPSRRHYDHVLLLGTMEQTVGERFDALKKLWDNGVRFDKIHLLGSERPLVPGHEPMAAIAKPDGTPIATEMEMMEAYYAQKSAGWPPEMQKVRIFEVNTFNKENGARANTRDTIESWHEVNQKPGSVLVISSQPYVRYQDAAVKSVLPSAFEVETVGAPVAGDMKVSIGMDTLARQIDVGLPRLLEKLKTERPALETKLRMFDPAGIRVDAATYQFRSGGDGNGVTRKGRFETDRWDPVLHGDPIMVHERLDGRVFVADGHHRLDLAKRLNEEGRGPGNIVAMVLREADGYTAQDAKIVAAYKNIAHGQTDPVDTARVFKEAYSGKVHTELLPHLQMDKGNLRMSFTMSRLSDKALDSVARGEVPAKIAAEIADRLPGNEARQEAVMAIIGEKLRQDYKMLPAAHPTSLQVNGIMLANAGRPLMGFAGKILQERFAMAMASVALH